MEIVETTLSDEEVLDVVEKLRISPTEIKVRRPPHTHLAEHRDAGRKQLPGIRAHQERK